MTTSGNAAAADTRLTALAAELASAEASDPPDPSRVAVTAWAILSELNEATYGRIDTERTLTQALTAAQASVAGARAGAPDPLVHIRSFLAAHGKMPPPGVTALTILAWQGPPPARAGCRTARCQVRLSRLARRGGAS
jgi:hypothetical protein